MALSSLLPIPHQQRTVVWSIGFFLFILLVPLVALLVGVRRVGQRLHHLDSIFAPLGLTSQRYLWNGRQYHGTLHGRQVDAYFYRGPSLDIYIAAPIHTRLGIGLRSSIARLLSANTHYATIPSDDPGLANLSIFSLDETWGRALLAEPQARQIIQHLLADQLAFELRNLLFRPDALHFQLYRLNLANLTSENLQSWVNDLFALIKIAESLPPPANPVERSHLELKARINRGDLTLPMAGVTCAILGGVALMILVILYLLFYLTGGAI